MQVEKLCLRWNDFKDNFSNAFGGFRENTDFNDVTLACEDGTKLEAHKVILSASSPFFKNLLSNEKHPHPLIYMVGVRSEDLAATVDFLYYGEVKVEQENLDSFLAIAKQLQLEGLMESSGEKLKRDQEVHPTTSQIPIKMILKEKIATKPDLPKENESVVSKAEDIKTIAVKEDFLQLDEQIQSLMEKGQSLILSAQNKFCKSHVCKVCGKEGMKNTIKKHIESNHVEGVFVPCSLCEKTFRSRDSLRVHNRRNH